MRSKVKKSKKIMIPICLLGILMVFFIGNVLLNRLGGSFENLGDTEQKLLKEYDTYYKAELEKESFKGFSLTDKPILMVNGRFGEGYIINPEKAGGFFCSRIEMPDDYSITVSRVARCSPQLLRMRMFANFNTIGEKYTVSGNDVYFIRYDRENSLEAKASTSHFIDLLTHESFHYYMQNEWPGGQRIDEELIRDEDMQLLGKKYELLAEIQAEVLSDHSDKGRLTDIARRYYENETERMTANPELFKAESDRELVEGTATYVGNKACAAVDYATGEMSYGKIMGLYNSGQVSKGELMSSLPYYSGAELCFMFDELGIDWWQAELNAQTKSAPKTLYDILGEYLSK